MRSGWQAGGEIAATMINQTLIDEIVTNVLAQLQPASVRPVQPAVSRTPIVAAPAIALASVSATAPLMAIPSVPAASSAIEVKPAVAELLSAVITADMLESAVRPGQTLRIGRTSILTPSARDWLQSKRTTWSRQDKAAANGGGSSNRAKWQIILQTVTPTVRALHEGLKRLSDGWKIELVGQPAEASSMATHLISTSECDGVVIFTEQAELVACRANRNERVRAAVMQSSKQWEQVIRTLSANVVCISPIGRTFVELRNLLRECGGQRPKAPAGM